MKRTSLPFVNEFVSKGKTYYYFRKGKTKVRLPDDPESEEFSRAYWECRSGKARVSKTSWDALIVSYYCSPAFKDLSRGTQANYRRHCEAIREKNGPKDMRSFRRANAIAARDALADTWSKANERVAVLSALCRRAVDLEWIERNPVVDVPKLKGGSFESWPDAKLIAYERYCDANGESVARTIYELAIGTGQRLGDCIAMRWEDFDGEYMSVVQEKTGQRMWIYCPPRLQAYLAALPKSGRHILAKNLNEPLGKRSVQRAAEAVREAIGAIEYVQHGWRYTAARRLAEAGCSDAEIQAVTGHRTLEMVQKYRAQANQKRVSKIAQRRMERNENETGK